ncbi:ATP-binding cassette domain-containing protein [Chryseobacterium camelliae]|uniref:ATP-binding cassette domain-containing protein n=1 Tax=Chryseobacterium camelliae TaxID=1265445 RepID=UPI000C1CB4B3|nr:ATP-binding cassette domain-containing protein [Chryseobacterium camelliae]
MSLLHIDSITKTYGEKRILQDIYIRSETGKVTGILGINGSGKSTLLKIISGQEKGDTGFIRMDDHVIRNQKDRAGRIAYLPQYSFIPKRIKIKRLIPLFCGRENAETLSATGLIQPFLNEVPGNLSTGEKRIAEALLILYSDSRFILLDEPFSGLSPKVTAELQKIIKEQSTQKGIMISDHHFQEVWDVSDHVYLMSRGSLKPVRDFSELQKNKYLPESI